MRSTSGSYRPTCAGRRAAVTALVRLEQQTAGGHFFLPVGLRQGSSRKQLGREDCYRICEQRLPDLGMEVIGLFKCFSIGRGPGSARQALTWRGIPSKALPSISSLLPLPYHGAVSITLTPDWRATLSRIECRTFQRTDRQRQTATVENTPRTTRRHSSSEIS
jgi:hypothetical protein